MRTTSEVATAIELLGDDITSLHLPIHVLKTLRALQQCRTAALGGHVDACTSCGSVHISYNSCRNRHCPKCQGHHRVQWIQKRESELLPTNYYHVVFTLPSELNTLCVQVPRIVYNSLFESVWQTVATFGRQKNLQMGMICILHTWGQNLSLHPHLHCIIPGGGIDAQGDFQRLHTSDKFLFSVKAMSKVFRAKYVACLRKYNIQNSVLIESLFQKNWVVFAKRPFGKPASVVEYLARYAYKVGISNSRIKSVSEAGVSFDYKDYKDGGTKKQMHLELREFIRRFAMHILPQRFVRIRHYGFLSSVWKRKKLIELQQKLYVMVPVANTTTRLHKCPHCKTGTMITIEIITKRGPPKNALTVQATPACN